MQTITYQLTNEIDALVSRAMRQGFLDPTELLGAFSELNLLPNSGSERAEVLAEHLCSLPPQLFLATQVTLVHQLDLLPYPLEASNPSPYRCAWQERNEHLLIEMSFGHTSLLHFGTHLCFLSQYYLECLEVGGAPGQFAHREDLSTEEMAAELDLTPKRLIKLIGASEQGFLKLLTGELTLPDIHIHGGLSPENMASEFEKYGLSILRDIAELGLRKRRFFLWIGNELPTYFLSPYVRELAGELQKWRADNPPGLGSDLHQAYPEKNEADLLYALALDFHNSDPTLREEFEETNRDVGIIHRQVGGNPYEIIDPRKLDYNSLDPRLALHKRAEAPAVILRLPHFLGDKEGQLLRTIASTLGKRVTGVTVAMNGRHLGHTAGSFLNADLIVRWAGKRNVPIPARSALGAQYPSNSGGVLLTGPCSLLISNEQIQELSKELGITGLTIGFGGLLEALADLVWSGIIPQSAQLSWPLVSFETNTEGRGTVESISGWANLMVSCLGPILGETKAPTPKKKQAPKSRPAHPTNLERPRFESPSAASVRDLNSGPILPPPHFDEPESSQTTVPLKNRPLRIKV